MEQKTEIKIECDSCSVNYGSIKFDNKSKMYLCDFCIEELDSLSNFKTKKTKMREYDS
jgi:hypothetical protein